MLYALLKLFLGSLGADSDRCKNNNIKNSLIDLGLKENFYFDF